MHRQDQRAGARPHSGGRHFAVASALLCLLAAGCASSLLVLTARAAPPPPAPVSTFLPERALPTALGAAAMTTSSLRSDAAHHAPKPGTGGWYWPVGTEDFGGYSGFLAPRGAYVHIAQDMRSPQGHPVYAVAAGTVFISRADAGGYGVGGAPGGCMIIVHRTAAGEAFRALYGHISGLKYKDGAQVAAGAVIATVNGCDHLHFSIHPSAVYRDGNPYAGHVPKSWTDHGGFVDPVKYLKTNQRAATYVPPAVPVVRITTGSAPSRFGAVGGLGYWDEEDAGGVATFAYDLVTGSRRELPADETAPPFDEVRYTVSPRAAPALGIAVRDRQPALAAAVRPVSPAWGAPAVLGATLNNAAAKPFAGARIALDRLAGAAWTRVAVRLTDTDGLAAFDYTPPRRTVLRLQFLPPATQPAQAAYVTAETVVVTVAPKVKLSVPALPTVVSRGVPITVGGSLVPRHATGEGVVRLEFQRPASGDSWAAALVCDVALGDAPEGSRYSQVVKLGRVGAWRVRATHPRDEAHAATAGPWRTFTVK